MNLTDVNTIRADYETREREQPGAMRALEAWLFQRLAELALDPDEKDATFLESLETSLTICRAVMGASEPARVPTESPLARQQLIEMEATAPGTMRKLERHYVENIAMRESEVDTYGHSLSSQVNLIMAHQALSIVRSVGSAAITDRTDAASRAHKAEVEAVDASLNVIQILERGMEATIRLGQRFVFTDAPNKEYCAVDVQEFVGPHPEEPFAMLDIARNKVWPFPPKAGEPS